MRSVIATCLVFLFSISVHSAYAEEIRIVGPLGLTRAVERTKGVVSVQVEVRTTAKSADAVRAIRLSNEDGIAEDVEPQLGELKGEVQRLLFSGIGGGSWRILVPDKKRLQIKSVRIVK